MSKAWLRWEASHDALLRELWLTNQTVKQFASNFPGRSYASIVQRATALDLGPRSPQVRKNLCMTPTDDLLRAQLKRSPMDAVELAAKAGVSERAAMERIRRMHERREVYVKSWERFSPGGCPSRIWALGDKPDAPRPVAATGAEKWQRRMTAMKKDRPAEYARVMARRRLQYRERAGRLIRRDPLTAAFFGEAAA